VAMQTFGIVTVLADHSQRAKAGVPGAIPRRFAAHHGFGSARTTPPAPLRKGGKGAQRSMVGETHQCKPLDRWVAPTLLTGVTKL